MMPPRSLRRLVAVAVCVASVLAPSSSATAGGSGGVLAGEDGSGPPAWAPPALARSSPITWSDVPSDHWARDAIDDVAGLHDWMRDYHEAEDGTYAFKPDRLESRRLFARALLRAFAPEAVPDPELSFPDVPETDRVFTAANVAVSNGWMETDPDGNFLPAASVTTVEVHRALVLAAGFGDLAAGADALHLRNGTPVPVPDDFGTTLLGMKLGLRYNHGDEALDVDPETPLARSEVAWSLYRATTIPDWMASWLAPYADMELPNLGPKMLRVVSFAVDYTGYPYVWGGEWFRESPGGYCCGYQPRGGFDCSGLTWWVMRAATEGWDNTPPRDYAGWSLPQRTSAQMAASGARVRWDDLRAGDLLFYDGDGDGIVDHVDTYVGNGWAIDSGGSNAGVTLTFVADNWYEEHFVHGRRILGTH